MRALGKWVVIDPINEEVRSDIGLIISSSEKDRVRYRRATILSVGDEVPNLEVGMVVYYDKANAHELITPAKTLTILRYDGVVLVD